MTKTKTPRTSSAIASDRSISTSASRGAATPIPELERVFKQVVKAYSRELKATLRAKDERACPDQFVGFVDGNGYDRTRCKADFEMREEPKDRPLDQPPIIIVLESPHKSEYPKSKKRKIGPARQSTGANIRLHLKQVAALLDLPVGVPRPLSLMNAVRHQCSLGVSTALHRDNVFVRMWRRKAVRDDFTGRLREYTADSGYILVNACTQGNFPKQKDELWRRVEELIFKTLGCHSHLSVSHPSHWKGKAPTISPRAI